MKQKLNNLVNISQKIGKCPDFVQGGGGNSSVKINNKLMAIKASGYRLSDMSDTAGFSFVNYDEIDKYISYQLNDDFTETEFSNFVKAQIIVQDGYPKLNPSIETGFHAMVDYKYVLHTHSVYANLLCCSAEGTKIISQIFPEALFIKYANPGKEITIAIKQKLLSTKAQIIFLQNHGLIVCADDHVELDDLHQEVNLKILQYFKITQNYHINEIEQNIGTTTEILFPDQIVYLSSEKLRSSLAGKETLSAYQYLMKTIKELGLTPIFISAQDVQYVQDMESEKYRKSLIQ